MSRQFLKDLFDDVHLSPRTLLLQQLHPLEISFKSHENNIIPVYYPITKTFWLTTSLFVEEIEIFLSAQHFV